MRCRETVIFGGEARGFKTLGQSKRQPYSSSSRRRGGVFARIPGWETVCFAGVREVDLATVSHAVELARRETERGWRCCRRENHLPHELVSTLVEAANVRIERIVSQGHVSPDGFWYDQDRHKWVIVLRGAARIRFEDRTTEFDCARNAT